MESRSSAGTSVPFISGARGIPLTGALWSREAHSLRPHHLQSLYPAGKRAFERRPARQGPLAETFRLHAELGGQGRRTPPRQRAEPGCKNSSGWLRGVATGDMQMAFCRMHSLWLPSAFTHSFSALCLQGTRARSSKALPPGLAIRGVDAQRSVCWDGVVS